jgi:putative transposase
MENLATHYPVDELADALEVSKSGFCAHAKKAGRPRAQRDRQLRPMISAIFHKSRRTYGSPRVRIELQRLDQRCGKNRVAKLMRAEGLRARQKRRFHPKTTQSAHALPIADNWLSKAPSPDRPDQLWQSDITYLPTAEGWLYLAVILDACSRKVVGWSVGDSLETPLVTRALERAVQNRHPSQGLLHHSDRGVQYASRDFRKRLRTSRITQSMSRKGNCYDNALAESFFATLKTECFGDEIPQTKAQARLMVFDYIETFYNSRRLHSALGYQSPVDFENQFN